MGRIKTVHTRGYYAYVIQGNEKTALIETAPPSFSGKFIRDLEEVISPEKIDCVIFNHTEPDRTGALEELLRRNKDITVMATIAGVRNIRNTVNRPINDRPVKHGEALDLGGATLKFIITPNLDWPDTMMTYCPEERALFSSDCFSPPAGKSSEDDLTKRILAPYAQRAAKRLGDADIKRICTGYGGILEGVSAQKALNSFRALCEQKNGKPRAAVVFASNYGFTEMLAKAAEETLRGAGFDVNIIELPHYGADIKRMLVEADAVAFGTPTVERSVPSYIWEAFSAVSVTAMQHKPAMVFGSCGWSGEGIVIAADVLKHLKLDVFDKPYRAEMKPSAEEMAEFKSYTERFAEYAKKKFMEKDYA